MSNPSDFIIEDGTLKKYVGSDPDVVIPEGVREIGGSAFKGNTALISVTVPDSVTLIYGGAFAGAFAGCSNLKHLELPADKIRIGDDAFVDCRALADENGLVMFYNTLFACFADGGAVTVPEGVTQIRGAFFENAGVTAVVLPESLGSYERRYFELAKKTNLDRAFQGCTNLDSIHLPDGIPWIPVGMFEGCEKLRELHLPDSVRGMDINAISGCRAMRLVVGRNVEQIIENKGEGRYSISLVMVLPKVTPQSVFSGAFSAALTMGFFQNRELYAPQIAEEYRKYACRQKLYLLPYVFRLDLPQALDFYDQNKKIQPKDFEKQWLEPAEKAGAVQCKAWLLDWRSRHKPKKDPFELSL